MITAKLSNYRITPRKVRLVADMIRGKSIEQAQVILVNVSKKAKHPLAGLLDSAIANAKNNFNIDKDNLMVKEIRVDQGFVLKRSMPMSKGSAFPIKKRTSHISLVLAPKVERGAKGKAQGESKTKNATTKIKK
ncbi:MAG: 50S ribosomal protein L22 [Candidatus Taylorbacteria bacterium]